MNSDDSDSEAPKPTMHNPLAVMQPGETIICEIKRHPIGMIGTYIGAGIVLILLAIIGFVVLPGAVSDSADRGGAMALGAIGFVLVALLVLVIVFIVNIIYWGNQWVVTSDSLTQMEQTSLFHKESSQLSLGNLEDVAADKRGILAAIFNYGTLKAETAGEREKFTLAYCPEPEKYAQKILAAREEFEQGHHGGKQPPYQLGPTPNPSADAAKSDDQSTNSNSDQKDEVDSYEVPS